MDEQNPKPTGSFMQSLVRNNRGIRADRAEAISEDAELIYKRAIEDLRVGIRKMERDRENMLDLSPENSMSLKLASDFDAASFVAKDVELGVKIRNERIKLEIVERQFKDLFGKEA